MIQPVCEMNVDFNLTPINEPLMFNYYYIHLTKRYGELS